LELTPSIHQILNGNFFMSHKVYGYVRVSTLMQVDGESLDTQSRQIQNYAGSKGWNLQHDSIFVEAGVSGSTDFQKRPQGQRLLDGLVRGDTIIFAKLDRAFRNVQNAFATLQQLKDLGINVHFIDLGGEVTGSGIGAVIFGVMSVFASFEKDRIASRIREVKQMQKAQGRFVGGRRAFGYNIVDGQKVQREDEQRVIVHMQEQRASGKSYRAIANWLKSNTSFELSSMGVREVLGKQHCVS
jgi:DNA invertase Pin-like site-specific DNA recombinase